MSTLTSLFGGGAKDYAAPYRDAATQTLRELGQVGDRFRGIADDATGQLHSTSGQVGDARAALLGLLGRRSGEADRARYINRATGNVDTNFLKAKSSLDNAFAGHDIDPVAYAGSVTNLLGSQAGARSIAANNADEALIAHDTGNAEDLYGILEDMQGKLKGERNAAMGNQVGVGEYRVGALNDIGRQEAQRAQQEQASKMAMIGGVTSILGKVIPGLGIASSLTGGGSGPTDEEWSAQNLPGNAGYKKPTYAGFI